MREIGNTLGIPLFVFGPETHMTAICGMALGKRTIPQSCNVDFATANFLLPGGQQQQDAAKSAQSDGGGDGGRFSANFSILWRRHVGGYMCYVRFSLRYIFNLCAA